MSIRCPRVLVSTVLPTASGEMIGARGRGRERLSRRCIEVPKKRRGLTTTIDLEERVRGFTLIELLVVLAIIATLLTIAVPRYYAHVDRAKEATLRESLNVMRESIDKFHADTGKLPDSLEELVTKRYLRKVPVDPITEASDSWVIVPSPNPALAGSVYDIKSGAPGNALDGTPYADW